VLFRGGFERGLIATWWVALYCAAVAWIHPEVQVLQIVTLVLILLGTGTLTLAWLITTWVWTRRPMLRAAMQVVTAGSTVVAGVFGAAFWYRDSQSADAAYFAQGMLLAAALMALSLLVMRASRGAWARADLHALFSPARERLMHETRI
jgi:glucan phosphoethanolaminetransferase (alkaline phosphatase superfamily)